MIILKYSTYLASPQNVPKSPIVRSLLSHRNLDNWPIPGTPELKPPPLHSLQPFKSQRRLGPWTLFCSVPLNSCQSSTVVNNKCLHGLKQCIEITPRFLLHLVRPRKKNINAIKFPSEATNYLNYLITHTPLLPATDPWGNKARNFEYQKNK